MEDQEDAPVVVAYRLGKLERAFEGFDKSMDDRLTAHGNRIDDKFSTFNEKLDEALFNKGQINLIDYRLKQLESWRSKFFAAITTVACGLALVLLTQIITLANNGSPK